MAAKNIKHLNGVGEDGEARLVRGVQNFLAVVLPRRLIGRSFLTYSVLLIVALSGTTLSIWTAREAQTNMDRIELANQSYQRHLLLSSHTYQLFKQFGDAMLIGDRDNSVGETVLIDKIEEDLEAIRTIIESEIDLVGSEEVDELRLLSEVESQVRLLVREYRSMVSTYERRSPQASWEALTMILDERVDREFDALIEEALAEELQEVTQTREEAERFMAVFTYLSIGLAFVALLAGGAAMRLLFRDIKRPIEALERGAVELGAGNWRHKVPTDFPTELEAVARAMNNAADTVAAREKSLKSQRSELEKDVEKRTRELSSALVRLEEQATLRRQLLADVSHELRTPLTVIRGEAGVALRGSTKTVTEYREALVKTKEAAEHTASLVDDLLFVARQEAGETRLDVVEADISEIVLEAVDQVSRLYNDDGVRIELDIDRDSHSGRFDPRRIRQVILILLENANLYGAPPIEVALRRCNGGYAITVHDHGEGITEDAQQKIFDRFFRGSNAAERYGDGSGLGLPVARSIVEAHGGTIECEGRSGEGARFTVQLPAFAPVRGVV